ncbi:MAG: hypothetical protein RR843_12415, partial [Clostridia bacterium]
GLLRHEAFLRNCHDDAQEHALRNERRHAVSRIRLPAHSPAISVLRIENRQIAWSADFFIFV